MFWKNILNWFKKVLCYVHIHNYKIKDIELEQTVQGYSNLMCDMMTYKCKWCGKEYTDYRFYTRIYFR